MTVSFTDAEGNPETLTSDPTGEVAAKPGDSEGLLHRDGGPTGATADGRSQHFCHGRSHHQRHGAR